MIKGALPRRLARTGLIAVCLAGATPAFAFDEGRGNTVDSIMNIFGMGDAKEDPVINYRERAPLVLPPRTDLRQPKPPVAARAPNWPQDQEVLAAKKRAAETRSRPERDDLGMEIVSARDIKNTGRIHPSQRIENPSPAGQCSMDLGASNLCDPTTYWNNLAVKNEGPEKGELVAGVEPDRRYLTQPPKGYMKATRNVKPTFEPKVADEDPRDYFRQKPKRDE